MPFASSPAASSALQHRPRLLGLAYRMLGELDGAEDVVQEAFLRWHEQAPATIRSDEAWLVTVVSRLALDRLRRASTERARYVGPWLPEPVLTELPSPTASPEEAVASTADLSWALLVLLETLTPEERVAFVLREVFACEYANIGAIVGRSVAATRQLVHRARLRVQERQSRTCVPRSTHERLLDGFQAALRADDATALVALLAPEVSLTTDGGGKVLAAKRRVFGPERVARVLLGVRRKFGARATQERATVNGQPALLASLDGALVSVTLFDVDDAGCIGAIYVVRNPHKLRRFQTRPLPLR